MTVVGVSENNHLFEKIRNIWSVPKFPFVSKDSFANISEWSPLHHQSESSFLSNFYESFLQIKCHLGHRNGSKQRLKSFVRNGSSVNLVTL